MFSKYNFSSCKTITPFFLTVNHLECLKICRGFKIVITFYLILFTVRSVIISINGAN